MTREIKKQPTISIITATYNSADYIADCVKSVVAQSIPVEHIIIDGASTDDTLQIIRGISASALIFSEPDRGIYDAMNKGIALATGDIIGFLNSDDLYADNYVLQCTAKLFSDKPEIDACYGDLCYVRREDISSIVRYWRSQDYKEGLFKSGWAPPHPTFFVRKGVYCIYRGFDLSYRIAADFELMLRLLEVHGVKAAYLPTTMIKMRLGGTTSCNFRNIMIQNLEIRRALKSHRIPSMLPWFLFMKVWTRFLQFIRRPL